MKAFVPFLSATSLIALAFSGIVRADEGCDPSVGRVVSVQGTVELQRETRAAWRKAALEDGLCRGDSIRVGSLSRAAVALANESILRIDENTTLNLISVLEEEESLLQMVFGAAQFFSRKPRALSVDTPYVNAAIEGTEFYIRVGPDGTLVAVFEGTVAASNAQGRVDLEAGQSAMTRPGEAPEPFVMVRPRDAVQWALYYPPVLATQAASADPVRGVPEAVQRAFDEGVRGNTAAAFARLALVPESERGPDFHLYRAALLLNVGRVDEARADIDKALAQAPDSSLAYALKAVIAVARNDTDTALADGRRAVELSPRSVPSLIALSYAEQSAFQLEAARDLLLRAVAHQPEDALAWARLAELWLALGYRERAVEAAETAARLAPDLDRTQTVLGFAALTAFQRGAAKEAFQRAIALNSADPLPRFGLGLAHIRGGDLKKGRADIEVAVGLDPDSALFRDYLGKAYFAERREQLAGEQYAIAKELDPKDPTAWLYDAILKQSENRPVEAYHDLEESIRLNDNRAVYRSSEELDQDQASRGASLARIYDDLGFQQLGINEAAKSLSLDPANASAHRFLSDSYVNQPRRDISRTSELLQAQMFQEININPVQPSAADPALNVFTNAGPAEAGLNEFTPLFERNQVQFNASGLVGNNDTKGGEGIVSGIYDQFSVSAGQYYYDTDGFRKNFRLEHSITNAFAQAAITPDLNVQVELRRRRTENGDLEMMFDPKIFSKSLQQDVDQDSARVGLRYSPTPQSDFLVSFIYTDRNEKEKETLFTPLDFPFTGLTSFVQRPINQEVPQGEAQYVFRHDMFNTTTGFMGYGADTSIKDKSTNVFDLPVPPFQIVTQTRTDSDRTILQKTAYNYTNIMYPKNVTWTVGLAYDDYDEDNINEEKISPKLGVQWNITDDIGFRAAAFRTVKPALVASRTLQPTQVAGFDQFYDDVNGTVADRYAVGLDARIIDDLRLGAEASWREVGQPASLVDGTSKTFNSNEEFYRAYAYWTPYANWAVSAEVSYDYFGRNKDPRSSDTPKHVKTFMVPVGVQYFDETGFFAGLAGTFVRQDVKRLQTAPVMVTGGNRSEGDDSFVTVDASVGYRFPHRRGLASLSVMNVFDSGFRYQDNSYRNFGEGTPSISRFIPERTIIARVTLSF